MFAYTVLAIVVAHALWFLLGDAAAVEFVKTGAPDYMWFGIIGLVLLFVLATIARLPDRKRVHRDYPQFLYWHRVLPVAAMACCTYHIIVSGFYLATWYQVVLFIAVACAASFGRRWWVKFGQLQIATPATLLLATVLFAGLFSALRNFSL